MTAANVGSISSNYVLKLASSTLQTDSESVMIFVWLNVQCERLIKGNNVLIQEPLQLFIFAYVYISAHVHVEHMIDYMKVNIYPRSIS